MTATLQAALAGDARGPSFAELRNRMELEFELARARHAPAAVLCVEVERLARFDEPRRARVLAALGAFLAASAPEAGLVAALDGAELLVLLHGTTVEPAETFARAFVAHAKRLTPADEPAPLRVGLAIGVAATRANLDPWFETLVAVAREGLEVARSNGGECCVHSELYELHQRRVERAKGARTPVPPPAAQSTVHAAQHGPQAAAASHGPASKPPATARSAAATDPATAQALPAPDAVPGLDLATIEARVLELAKAAFERALAEREAKFQSELDHYERRIAKMQRALTESEQEKERLARTKGLESGLSSVYRDVQGLTGNELDFEQRSGLLRAIAESNLELHEALRRRTA